MIRPAAWSLLWALAAIAAELPVGTEIHVRLQSKVTSNQSKAGENVRAAVIAPVIAGGEIVIPAGAALTGTIKRVQASAADQRAIVELEFGEIAGSKLAARVVAVDNARETVDDAGCVLGILSSETLTAQMDHGLEKLTARSPRIADFLLAAKNAILKPADVEIAYEPGVEMTVQLTAKAAVRAQPGAVPPGIAAEAILHTLVNRLPFQTVAEKPPQPSDITNLMFIGTRERVEAAFVAAGWMTAAQLNATSGLETFRAIAENRGYREAPMSILLLEGNKPDLVFQKQQNTFAKRHHLRIWIRPETFQGHTVWVCAATHDIGIEFSPENRTFIHKIDSQIDRERAKVVNDLLLTGQVKGLALVDRPGVPRQSQNATGDKLETDGSMAVLLLELGMARGPQANDEDVGRPPWAAAGPLAGLFSVPKPTWGSAAGEGARPTFSGERCQ